MPAQWRLSRSRHVARMRHRQERRAAGRGSLLTPVPKEGQECPWGPFQCTLGRSRLHFYARRPCNPWLLFATGPLVLWLRPPNKGRGSLGGRSPACVLRAPVAVVGSTGEA